MIRQGPELYEWEYLLECEAKRVDHELNWYYTGASFELKRNGIRLELTVQPVIGSSELSLYLNNSILVHLKLENIIEARLTNADDKEGFILFFDNQHLLKALIVQTKPVITLDWGSML